MRVDDNPLPRSQVSTRPVTLDGQLLRDDDFFVLGDLLDRAYEKNNPWHLSLVPLREAFHTTGTLVTDGRSRTALIDLLRTELIYRQQDSIALLLKGWFSEGRVMAEKCRSLWKILKRIKRVQHSPSGPSPSPTSPDTSCTT